MSTLPPVRRHLVLLVLAVVLAAGAWLAFWWRSDDRLNVPLGVEQAAIITYGGPRLVVKPFRWGVAVNVRIAEVTEVTGARVYDVRYLVNRAGEHDLTSYLMSESGGPAEGLPSFKVRGDPKLSKELEARVRETEAVDIDVPGHYRATLAGLGVLWLGWLLLLVFYGRSRVAPPTPVAAPLGIREEILGLIARLEEGRLDVAGRARLEMLLLRVWREGRVAPDAPMSVALESIARDERTGEALAGLQRWLHRSESDLAPGQLAVLLRAGLPPADHPAPGR